MNSISWYTTSFLSHFGAYYTHSYDDVIFLFLVGSVGVPYFKGSSFLMLNDDAVISR